MIYIAAPYTFDESTPEVNKKIETRRYYATMEFCARLVEAGKEPISPVVHWHEASRQFGLGSDAAFWQKYNLNLLLRCNKMWIYGLPGWEISPGVTFELHNARVQGMETKISQPSRRIIQEHKELLENARN